VDAIKAHCDLVSVVTASISTDCTAQVGTKQTSADVIGVSDDYRVLHRIDMASGRFIDHYDNENWTKACVIGSRVASKLFGGGDCIGKIIQCHSHDSVIALTVVGVTAPKARSGFGPNYNRSIFLSISTVQKRIYGETEINSFNARSVSVAQTQAAADQIWGLLKRRHPRNAQEFVVDTQTDLLKQIDNVLMIFQLILGGVGGLALLTGGIGIMNIMLVSVTERTREIGIRKALGATRFMILLQFVVEAMVVSGLGGILGVATAFGAAKIVNSLQDKIYMFIPFWAVLLGVGFAMGVGLFFGIYPAVRASKLDPINALRYE
jgi:putative ABC transport system permease protein